MKRRAALLGGAYLITAGLAVVLLSGSMGPSYLLAYPFGGAMAVVALALRLPRATLGRAVVGSIIAAAASSAGLFVAASIMTLAASRGPGSSVGYGLTLSLFIAFYAFVIGILPTIAGAILTWGLETFAGRRAEVTGV